MFHERELITARLSMVLMMLLAPSPAVEAQQPLPELSLEELMGLDAGRVFGASERLQPVTEAPASGHIHHGRGDRAVRLSDARGNSTRRTRDVRHQRPQLQLSAYTRDSATRATTTVACCCWSTGTA